MERDVAGALALLQMAGTARRAPVTAKNLTPTQQRRGWDG